MPIKNRQQLLLVLAGLAVGLLVADAFIFTPLTKAWRDRAARITALRSRLEAGGKLLERAEVLNARWAQMQ